MVRATGKARNLERDLCIKLHGQRWLSDSKLVAILFMSRTRDVGIYGSLIFFTNTSLYPVLITSMQADSLTKCSWIMCGGIQASLCSSSFWPELSYCNGLRSVGVICLLPTVDFRCFMSCICWSALLSPLSSYLIVISLVDSFFLSLCLLVVFFFFLFVYLFRWSISFLYLCIH